MYSAWACRWLNSTSMRSHPQTYTSLIYLNPTTSDDLTGLALADVLWTHWECYVCMRPRVSYRATVHCRRDSSILTQCYDFYLLVSQPPRGKHWTASALEAVQLCAKTWMQSLSTRQSDHLWLLQNGPLLQQHQSHLRVWIYVVLSLRWFPLNSTTWLGDIDTDLSV